MLHVVKNLGGTQQRLGRNAAPVEADAAEIGFFDNSCLETKLGRTDRGDVAARSGTDDDDVEGCVGHAYSGLRRSSGKTSIPAHTIIITGFSLNFLNAPISSAPSAPSIAR